MQNNNYTTITVKQSSYDDEEYINLIYGQIWNNISKIILLWVYNNVQLE